MIVIIPRGHVASVPLGETEWVFYLIFTCGTLNFAELLLRVLSATVSQLLTKSHGPDPKVLVNSIMPNTSCAAHEA